MSFAMLTIALLVAVVLGNLLSALILNALSGGPDDAE